ncbi:uncharacterized [Tachysurus ichikawai]
MPSICEGQVLVEAGGRGKPCYSDPHILSCGDKHSAASGALHQTAGKNLYTLSKRLSCLSGGRLTPAEPYSQPQGFSSTHSRPVEHTAVKQWSSGYSLSALK